VTRHTVTVDNTSPEPKPPREDLLHRAEHLAQQGLRLPPWLRPGNIESRWPVLFALIIAIVLQTIIPKRYTVVPRWPVIALEVLLLIILLVLNPVRLTRSTRLGKTASLVLLAAITADNTGSAFVLDFHIINGTVSKDAGLLLGSGAAIFVTNIIAFGIWYWELDRGGPFRRAGIAQGDPPPRYPDFMFPQMINPRVAAEDWDPRFLDYLYVSATNVMAFSPTDTMPLSRRSKALMTVQAVVAVSTLALVFARAVNVLS
jgi:hypothetical protein